MVDFKKRLNDKDFVKSTNPIDIYEHLDRRSEAGPLRPSQKKILEDWYQNRKNEKNNIIKLHTGEGKTLIGLLFLQSKINAEELPCVYVCPNKYLMEQVKLEAEKFGIPFCFFNESNDFPDDFLAGKKILITYVQKIFNGKTVFGIGSKSLDISSIILDDSHACIDSIKNSLTIKVNSQHSLYEKILNIFENEIREQGEGSFLEIKSGDYNTMLPIPYWAWYDKKEEVAQAIIQCREDKEIMFIWPVIKDSIPNCQAFISGSYLEISPTLMPIDTFGTFSKAKHRILMSATTQDDSFFIKGLGFDLKSVNHPLSNDDLKWSGEKMILIPSLIDEGLDRNVIVNWLCASRDTNQFGIVSLIPSFNLKEQYEKIGAHVASTKDIFTCVKKLKDGLYDKCIVFANRYDGIDLPDSSCRILILDSKPYFDSLLDRYEEGCRSESDIVNIRVAQKVEQGLGRSVRGEKDYSVIVLIGSDLIKFIKSPMTSKYFSPQTRKQIEIGFQVAGFAKEDSDIKAGPYKIVTELINQVLARDEGWKFYYSEEMQKVNDDFDKSNVYDILYKEYNAERLFSLGEYDKACSIAQELCDLFSDKKEEKGWYLQQLARYKYRTSKVDSNNYQKIAFQNNLQLLKPKDGISYTKIEYINQNRIKRINEWLSKFNDYQEAMLSIESILQDLTFGMPSEKFELAMKQLGEAIGFLSQRPDKEIKKGPDNLWCGVENQYFLIECKNEVDELRSEISKQEAGQMNSHCAWFESIYQDAKCKRIMVIPTKKLSYHADFTHEVNIMRKGSLNKLKANFKAFFKEFAQYSIHEVSDQKIQQFIDTHNLDIESMEENYSENYVKSNRA